MNKYNINFSHPWSLDLYTFKVPIEKHKEFYEKFGMYYYTNDTNVYKLNAYKWIFENGIKNK